MGDTVVPNRRVVSTLHPAIITTQSRAEISCAQPVDLALTVQTISMVVFLATSPESTRFLVRPTAQPPARVESPLPTERQQRYARYITSASAQVITVLHVSMVTLLLGVPAVSRRRWACSTMT